MPTQKTKIVCTIGPASRSQAVLKRMIQSGMSVSRVNLAHGELDTQKENIRRIRSAATRLNRPVSILIDLPGPKIRIGQLQSEGLLLRWLRISPGLTSYLNQFLGVRSAMGRLAQGI